MQQVTTEIISIGNELLYGQTLDTNAHWLCTALTQIGIKVVQTTTVGDEEEAILRALVAATKRAAITITTGGLGPTQDDLTKQALVRYLNNALVRCKQTRTDGQPTSQAEENAPTPADSGPAAWLAHGSSIANQLGTVPGVWLVQRGKVLIALPGVPYAMEQMMHDTVLPRLRKNFDLPASYHKTIHTIGIAEPQLAALIKPWAAALPSHIQLAYLTALGTVRLRLTAVGTHLIQLQQQVLAQVHQLQSWAAPYIYGYDEDTLEAVVGRALQVCGKTLAIAESCSGGYASHLITRVPGSSAYYKGSIVPYQNTAKQELLGIPAATLEQHGPVSSTTAIAMAKQVKAKFQATIGLASTGIAGPSGGSATQPVGTVWIALADEQTSYAEQLQLGSHRCHNIQLTALYLLNLLRKSLLKAS